MRESPSLVVLAGPYGAGKSTVAPILLRDTLGIEHFVNADEIAKGLSAFRSGDVAIAAGRMMLTRLRELAAERVDFAFETTLASKTFAPWIAERIADGFVFELVFLWLPKVENAIERVAARIREGGHAVPEDTIRRRYAAGLRNFFRIYRPLTTKWTVYDNSMNDEPRRVAEGQGTATRAVLDVRSWSVIESEWNDVS